MNEDQKKFMNSIDTRIESLQKKLDSHQKDLEYEVSRKSYGDYGYHTNRISEFHAKIAELKMIREQFSMWCTSINRQ